MGRGGPGDRAAAAAAFRVLGRRRHGRQPQRVGRPPCWRRWPATASWRSGPTAANCSSLAGDLSQSGTRVAVDPALLARNDALEKAFPVAAGGGAERATATCPTGCCCSWPPPRWPPPWPTCRPATAAAEELVADLQLVGRSLAAHRGAEAGPFAVRRTLRRVETFGFHLLTLDLRQDARAHRPVVGRLLGETGWNELPAAERAAQAAGRAGGWCGRAGGRCGGRRRSGAGAGGFSRHRRMPAALRRARHRPFHRQHDPGARRPAGGPPAVALGQPRRKRGEIPLDVAPLFETVPDLAAAPGDPRAAARRPVVPGAPQAPWRTPDGDGRLFRQQQGRRLDLRPLGPAAGAAAAGRHRRAARA